jgi:hypothetical protein
MGRMTHQVMAWCGVAFAVFLFAGLITTGFLPPIPPDHTAQEVANQYARDQDRIIAGAVMMMIGAGFLFPFTAVISIYLARIDSNWRAMSLCQLASGAIGIIIVLIPLVVFVAAAYRPERDPEITQALSDLAFLPFVMAWVPAFVQWVSIAVGILSDGSDDPLLPRWLAYVLLFAAADFAVATFVPFFYDGPFAWNGLVCFWVAAVIFGNSLLALVYGLLRAIDREFAVGSGVPLTARS